LTFSRTKRVLGVGVLGCLGFRILVEFPHFPISPFPHFPNKYLGFAAKSFSWGQGVGCGV
jgi:hypothetical protein